MKKLLVVLFAILAVSSVWAQHSVTLTWTPTLTPSVSGYNVYRAPCTGTVTVTGTTSTCSIEGTFTKLTSIGMVTTYVDTAVTAGAKYAYYLTSVCPAAGCSPTLAGESLASNHAAADIPLDKPLPPGNLQGAPTNISSAVKPQLVAKGI